MLSLAAEERHGLLGHPDHPAQSGTSSRRSLRLPRPRGTLSFVLISAFSVLTLYALLSTFVLPGSFFKAIDRGYLLDGAVAVDEQFWPHPPPPWEYEHHYQDHELKDHGSSSHQISSSSVLPTPAAAAPATLASEDGLLELSEDELRAMVARTKGYFARDYTLALGWNNVRYIIESAVLQASILNRTLIIPSFVYSRACEYPIDVCARYARMVNRGDALYTDDWRHLPMEQQLGFVIPIEVMLDIPHLRKKHSVLMTSEYLHLQGLNISKETSNGNWDREFYHTGLDKPSLFMIPNNIYDPDHIVRVDAVPPLPSQLIPSKNELMGTSDWMPSTEFGKDCDRQLQQRVFNEKKVYLEWDQAVEVLEPTLAVSNGTSVEEALEAAGWVTLYTWKGALGMEYIKSVVQPTKQVARYSSLQGFRDNYAHVTQDVVYLQGEVHLGRKPGGMKFTSVEARTGYARTVLYDVSPSERVKSLAKAIIKRMDQANEGRQWVAGHMRRGDFANAGWLMEGSVRNHLKRILQRLNVGRQIVERLRFLTPEPYEIPDVVPREVASRRPPLEGDYVYLATDERTEEGLQVIREANIKLFKDLVTIQDRREFGWTLLFTDIISLVEQQVIGNGAAYSYGHSLSSVTGGILNIRAAAGYDSRTALVD